MDQPEEGGGDLMSTVSEVGEGLSALAQLPQLEPADKEVIAQMLSQFNDLVEKYAGQGQAMPADDSVPMEAGMSGKPISPAMKN